MKSFFRAIHLYLSLAAGLVILIACFTGAVLVFEKELQEAFNKDRYFVEATGQPLPLDQLVQQVQQEVPGAKVAGVKVYADPGRSTEISISKPEKEKAGTAHSESPRGEGKKTAAVATSKPEAQPAETKPTEAQTAGGAAAGAKGEGKKGGGGGGRPSHTVFVNQYSGEVLEVYSYRETFFYTMFALHRWLLGSNDGIGKYIVGVSTFIFLFILITGIVLWWPKTRQVLAQRLKVKFDGSWKRLNHDFHIVLGFYSAIFLFIFAFTGLSWSFEWFNKGLNTVTGADVKPADPPASVVQANLSPIALERVLTAARAALPETEYYHIRAPRDSAGVFSVGIHQTAALNEAATDTYYVDQYSGQVIGAQLFADKTAGQQFRSSVKAIHLSSIYGIPSKVIGFVTCLLGVTFPITGVVLWLNRLKKNKKKKAKVLKSGAPRQVRV